MRVNKNLLLQKTDKELEDYIKPNKGYVTDAIEYAVEILGDRNYEFSEEQSAYIASVLKPEEKKEVHKDYLIASNFILASAATGIVSFLYGTATITDFPVLASLLSLLIVSGLGLLARVGNAWLKYGLLLFSMFGFFIAFSILFFFPNPIVSLITLFIQTVLQTIAVVFLFKAPAEKPK